MSGIELISAERTRQQLVERWSGDHDDAHTSDELARAAATYALPEWARSYSGPLGSDPDTFPRAWHGWWKPTPADRIRELVKAGALIAAEIDRLIRKESSQ